MPCTRRHPIAFFVLGSALLSLSLAGCTPGQPDVTCWFHPTAPGCPGSTGPSDGGGIDAGTGNTDAGTGNTDAGTGSTDAGTGNTDAGTGNTDAGTGSADAGTGSADAGTGSADAGTGSTDAGTGGTDAGTDAGEHALLPDPLLLPEATTAQVPLKAIYDALAVPAMPAGGTYREPTTGITIHKLTTSVFPAASPSWNHDYAEGGDEISLPYNGTTRAILMRQSNGVYWLVDFTPGGGVGNARVLPRAVAPFMDLSFTFSNNPATPYYAFVSTGTAIVRIDLRTLAPAPGGGWPLAETNATWLHQSENDGMFVWMRGSTGPTMAVFQPASGILKTYTDPHMNEPRIDRGGRYVGLCMNSPLNALTVWDWDTGAPAWSTPGDPGIPFAHVASLRGRWMGVDWNMNYPPAYTEFVAATTSAVEHIGGPANATLVHGSGNWLQHPADSGDQWALFTHYGSLRPTESFWLAPGGMVFVTPNGERRLLGHPYNTSSNYTLYTFAKPSSDGRYVLFTSDMDGSGRSDLFLAEVPVH